MLLTAPEIVCMDSKEFGRAASMSYGARGLKLSHKFPGSELSIRARLESIAKEANLGYCRCRQASPLFEAEDVDDNVVWHMSLEIELLRRAMSKSASK